MTIGNANISFVDFVSRAMKPTLYAATGQQDVGGLLLNGTATGCAGAGG